MINSEKQSTCTLELYVFFFIRFFLIWTIFKLFIEFVTLLLHYSVLYLGFLTTRYVGSCYSPPGCCVHRILQARILQWVAIFFSRGSSDPGSKPQFQADSIPSEPPGNSTVFQKDSPVWEVVPLHGMGAR